MNYFIKNLFVGAIINTYNQEKEKSGSYFLLSKTEKKWLEAKLLLIQAKPKLFIKEPIQTWRKPFYKVL